MNRKARMMLKRLDYINIGLLSILLMAGCVKYSYYEHHYNMNCTVLNVAGPQVTVLDEVGEVFAFEGSGFSKNDKVVVTFFDNCTDTIRKDDIIEGVE